MGGDRGQRAVSLVVAGLASASLAGIATAQQQPDYYAGCPEGENTVLGTNDDDVIKGTPCATWSTARAGTASGPTCVTTSRATARWCAGDGQGVVTVVH